MDYIVTVLEINNKVYLHSGGLQSKKWIEDTMSPGDKILRNEVIVNQDDYGFVAVPTILKVEPQELVDKMNAIIQSIPIPEPSADLSIYYRKVHNALNRYLGSLRLRPAEEIITNPDHIAHLV